VTGFATANSEGMPVVGLGGAVPRAQRLKQAHQSLDTVTLFKPVTKYSAEVDAPEAIGEILAAAFRAAESGRPGAAFISLPMDIMTGAAPNLVLAPVRPQELGAGPPEAIADAVQLINQAKVPVLLLGMQASEPANATAVRALLEKVPLPCVCTYQGAGIVPRSMIHLFVGRVGLFHNQPADQLLDQADVVITVGYDPIEYDESLWNHGKHRSIVHIDNVPSDIDVDYKPTVEIIGSIAASLTLLAQKISPQARFAGSPLPQTVHRELEEIRAKGAAQKGTPIHPLRIISDLQPFLSDDVTFALDMGSVHIWHLRYLYSFRPGQMMITNGQQTLGVGLPWAIAACLARPRDKVISVSGDGGFLFSGEELETAVRLKCNFVHMIWRDGHYDMVAFQERMKYGRTSGCDFGPVDTVKYAEAFGAKGFAIKSPDEFAPTLRKALDMAGPVLIDIPVDYSHNLELGEQMHPDVIV
jgi:acetolactate synthase I/II/III large subunit